MAMSTPEDVCGGLRLAWWSLMDSMEICCDVS